MREENSAQINYMNSIFGKEMDTQSSIREALKKDNKTRIHISPYEAQILSFFVKFSGAKRILEIGSLYGYSTFCLAHAAGRNSSVYACEKCPKNISKAKELMKGTEELNRIQWYSGEALPHLDDFSKEEDFDLIFIDADKSNYNNYRKWAVKHLKTKGLLIADNSFLFGSVYHEPRDNTAHKHHQVMVDFNNDLSNLKLFNSMIIPTFEGLTVAQKI
ncbi:MAG: hypothetical protein HAW63_04920 [Bdellovibrionaceae bacterium]|nr:hypothetical protein [Pseudobdellovibrionaceae bacterium]